CKYGLMAMSQEINLECYSCSPDKKVLHEVLHSGKKLVVRCARCQVTHQAEPADRTPMVRLKVVVSDYDQSYVRWFEVGVVERLRVRDEMIVENGSIDAVRITAIELSDGVRATEAVAETIRAVWAQKIDKVVVKVAVHTGGITRSHRVPFDGEKEFVVGHEEQLGKIARVKVKGGPVLDRAGQSAKAKDVGRVYVKGSRGNERYRSAHPRARKSEFRR
ncbi:MAG: HVO_0476 family zinc finger protein, partial [Halobacteriota archaeon]